MIRLLGILILIISVVLFPPASLAVVSNNAVPGDRAYPIKRGLEDVIYAIASIHPTTKTWFSAARSDRRFKEITLLITKGKQINQVSQTLDELVEQTQATAAQINEVTDQKQKAQLVEQLTESIKKYDQGLAQISTQDSAPQPSPQATTSFIEPTPSVPGQPKTSPSTSTSPVPTPKASSAPRPSQAPRVTPTPRPTSTTVIPTAAPTRIPTPTSAPTPNPTVTAEPTTHPSAAPATTSPSPASSYCHEIQNPIERARCLLKEIGQGFGTTSSPSQPNLNTQERNGQDNNSNENNNRGGDESRGNPEGENDNRGQGRDR